MKKTILEAREKAKEIRDGLLSARVQVFLSADEREKMFQTAVLLDRLADAAEAWAAGCAFVGQ